MTFKLILQRPIVRTLLLNLAFLLLCLGIGGIHFGSMDDYFMSSIVTGAYGGVFDAHTLFVNGAYAYFLKPFYTLFPNVGWYFIFELLFVFAAFNVFTYFMLKQVGGRLGVVIALFVLSCLTPDFYLQLAFTQCAAVSSAAGILLFYFGTAQKKRLWLLLGFIFFVVGIVMRREGFLLGVPFLAVLLGYAFIRARKIYVWTAVALVASVAAYFALHAFNQNLFKESTEYSYYQAYQGPRATFGDGSDYDFNTTYDELEERGLQGWDFGLLKRWIFYDTRVFSLDSLKPYLDVLHRNRYELNKAKFPVALFYVVANSFFKTNAWCWALLCIVLFAYKPKRGSWYTWGSLALMAMCLGYLLMQNRVVYHVETGIWLYAIFGSVPLLECRKCLLGNDKNLTRLILVLALGCFVFGMSTQRGEHNDRALFGIPKMSTEWQGLYDHMKAHQEDVFLIPFEAYKTLAIYSDTAYKAVQPGSWGNIIPLGYWNMNLPGMKREMENRGVTNPIGDIVKENVYVLEDFMPLHLEKFYRTHYGVELDADTVVQFDGLKLMKYHAIGEAP